MTRIYFDHNASAPLTDSARAAVIEAMDVDGNGSSVHTEGRASKKLIENARGKLADHLGVASSQVVFTSGASEAAMQALSPNMRIGGKPTKLSSLYLSAIEHPCVLSGGRFEATDLEMIPVLKNGIVDLTRLEELLIGHDEATGRPMVAVMLANNETGAIQPIAEITELVHAHNGILVVDAVQGLGKIPINVAELGADMLFVSSHKIGGPKGAGALILANPDISPTPLISGGGQEGFHRAGTENIAAIAGFAAAVEEIEGNLTNSAEISALRDSIEQGLMTISSQLGAHADKPVFFSADTKRLDNTTCFAVPNIKSETALISLDLAGIAISSGSACSSGKVRKSHVLSAMGVSDELANCALRVSIGPKTNKQDAERFLGAWKDLTSRVLKDAA